jgi:hypothetical protein
MPRLAVACPRPGMKSHRIAVAEARVRPGEVGIEGQPVGRCVEIGPFDAVAARRARSLGRAGIADEKQFGSGVELPQCYGRSAILANFAAHAALVARVRTSGLTGSTGVTRIGRIDPDRRAARIVGMKALTVIEIELGLLPRPEDQSSLGVTIWSLALPEFRQIGVDREIVGIGHAALHRAEPEVQRVSFCATEGQAALGDPVLAHRVDVSAAWSCCTGPPDQAIDPTLQTKGFQHLETAPAVEKRLCERQSRRPWRRSACLNWSPVRNCRWRQNHSGNTESWTTDRDRISAPRRWPCSGCSPSACAHSPDRL